MKEASQGEVKEGGGGGSARVGGVKFGAEWEVGGLQGTPGSTLWPQTHNKLAPTSSTLHFVL